MKNQEGQQKERVQIIPARPFFYNVAKYTLLSSILIFFFFIILRLLKSTTSSFPPIKFLSKLVNLIPSYIFLCMVITPFIL